MTTAKTKATATSAATHQAPDTATSPAKQKRDQRAKHELLDASGTVGDDDLSEEQAHGIRYTLLANGKSFDYQYGKSGDADRMLALFGAKTLCTNETSAARNNTKGEASPDEQIAAVEERFALLSTGVWVDRTREGVGAKLDPDALAQAIVDVLLGEGKIEKGAADATRAERRAKIEADAAWGRKIRTFPPVAARYNEIVGRSVATVDDLMA